MIPTVHQSKNYFSILQKYFELENRAISTVRAGNVIGGGDWSKDRIVPDLQMLKKKRINYRMPNSARPWQHVLEPIYGYFLLAKTVSNPKNLELLNLAQK